MPAKVTLVILNTVAKLGKILTGVNFSGISIVFYSLKIIFKYLPNFAKKR